ncbi:uracil phosphoribosyltransferase-like [Pungitius pungitius]|uniref:uracil phosphoribosyltransferase-like n=1 Tax=Pungitius pungitius TaxID=134920 RepID=UPI002E121072
MLRFQSSVSAEVSPPPPPSSRLLHGLVSADHRRICAAGGGDDGARPEGRVQGRPHRQDPHRQDPHPDQARLKPELHYLRLPKDISEDHVVLMDSTVSTGAAAMTALRVLLDHEVQEEKIALVSLLMAELGVHSVAFALPKVKIITTAVDQGLDDLLHLIPGIGDFGDRYFGTVRTGGGVYERLLKTPFVVHSLFIFIFLLLYNSRFLVIL